MPNGSQIINYFFSWSELLYLFNFIFQLCWVFIAAHRLSQFAVIRHSSLVSAHRLLIMVASFVSEHSSAAQGLR